MVVYAFSLDIQAIYKIGGKGLSLSCYLFSIYPFCSFSLILKLSSGLSCQEPCQALLTKWKHGLNPFSSSRRHGPGMKELGLVILTFSLLSSVELAGKNIKVLERSMRKHKAFCSYVQKIIYKITIDICLRIFTKNVPG